MPVRRSDASKLWRGSRARVRMYRVGLGDCFLLSVKEGRSMRHMLIDCGMFAGSRLDKALAEPAIQTDIVKHIAAETKGKLDVLVVTHEHMDHVSIFNSARADFEKIKVGETWLGWVESNTKAARDLRSKYEIMEADLTAALAALDRLPNTEKAFYGGLHDAVTNVAEFLGFHSNGTRDTALGAAKAVKPQPRAAMDFVKSRTRNQKFGSPGDIWEFAGLKAYVLGPPPAEKQMRIMERAGATYDKALGVLSGSGNFSVEGLPSPFDARWQQPVGGTGTTQAFTDPDVEASLDRVLRTYNDPHEAWRRIDSQALDSAPTLALQMDNYINNTSLALAFEFQDKSKDVMLFPGDAQVGNWSWWFQIGQFDVKDLLRRTVFYKVGHHGSHNATLKQALELMNHPKLVAMMPTNEAFARTSKHWEMPARNLRVALLDHARRRVLRNDQGLPGVRDKPMDDGDWGKLKNNVVVERLFIDYYL